MPSLVGRWVKTSEQSCDRVYPRRLEFRDGGLYQGSGSEPGPIPGWDRGTWDLAGPHTVRVSTLNDAIVAYEFDFDGGTLVFRDPGGCEFRYRREGEREATAPNR